MPYSLSKNMTPFPDDDSEILNLIFQCLKENNQSPRPLKFIADYFNWTLTKYDELKLIYLLDSSEHLDIILLGNLGNNAYKLKPLPLLKIIEHGSFKTWQNLVDSDQKVKHKILAQLMIDTNKSFWAKDLSKNISISFDHLHYLADQMKTDGSVSYIDASSFEGADFCLKISPKGKGMFIKKEYLHPVIKQSPLINMTNNSTTVIGDGNTVASNHSSNASKTQETTNNNAATAIKKKKTDWPLILKIVAGVIVIISAILKIFGFV